jgi:site-specific DNA recombinase
MTLPWTSPNHTAVKGVIHMPVEHQPLKSERRDALLIAIAKARRWIKDLTEGRAASFAEIAAGEGKVERLIRMRASLAFLSPRIIAAIVDGSAPADLTVTRLANALPHAWAEQECQIGLRL